MTIYKLCGDTKGESLIVAYENEDPVTVPDTHPRFNEILELLRSGKATDDEIQLMVNTLLVAGKKLSSITERVSVAPYGVFFDGEPLRSELADILIQFTKDGNTEKLDSVAKFLENAAANQTFEGIDAMYRWITNGDLVITSDGTFLAYKAVQDDGNGSYTSITSGKALVDGEVHEGNIPNHIGAVVTMPRSEVTDKTSVNCGPGLHAGTFGYAEWFSHYGQGGRKIILVEINPRDVVSVPSDHSCAKLRVSRYVVKEEVEQRLEDSFYGYPEYEDDDDDDYEDWEEDWEEDEEDWDDDGDFTDEDEVDAPHESLKDEIEKALAAPVTDTVADNFGTVVSPPNTSEDEAKTKPKEGKFKRIGKWLAGE